MKHILCDNQNTDLHFVEHEYGTKEEIPIDRARVIIKESCGRMTHWDYEGKYKRLEIISREEYESSGRRTEDEAKIKERDRKMFGDASDD